MIVVPAGDCPRGSLPERKNDRKISYKNIAHLNMNFMKFRSNLKI